MGADPAQVLILPRCCGLPALLGFNSPVGNSGLFVFVAALQSQVSGAEPWDSAGEHTGMQG